MTARSRRRSVAVSVGMRSRHFPEQPAPRLDTLRIGAGELERLPHDGGDGVVDRDAELALQRLNQRCAAQAGTENGDGLRLFLRDLAHHAADLVRTDFGKGKV